MFIVFEGPDHVGKSTLVKMFNDELSKKYKIYLTREPGGTPIGIEIEKILKDVRFKDIDKTTEAFLFAADRAQHVQDIVNKMDEGFSVISDRYIQSSMVYQGYMKNNTPIVYQVNHLATKGLRPDLIIYIKASPKECMTRANSRDRIEEENNTLEAIKELHDIYDSIIHDERLDKIDIITIDTTNKTAEESFKELIEAFKPYAINLKKNISNSKPAKPKTTKPKSDSKKSTKVNNIPMIEYKYRTMIANKLSDYLMRYGVCLSETDKAKFINKDMITIDISAYRCGDRTASNKLGIEVEANFNKVYYKIHELSSYLDSICEYNHSYARTFRDGKNMIDHVYFDIIIKNNIRIK